MPVLCQLLYIHNVHITKYCEATLYAAASTCLAPLAIEPKRKGKKVHTCIAPARRVTLSMARPTPPNELALY